MLNRKILIGDVMEKIKEIENDSIDVVISSPPYWGLRDYGTGKWVGGNNPLCEHSEIRRKTRDERKQNEWMEHMSEGTYGDESKWKSNVCPNCKARYEDSQWGSETDFHDYLNRMKLLMDELKRVLKPTGTCWINLGDSYGTHRSEMSNIDIRHEKQERNTLKGYEKSRMGIPERFYIQCIDDGWIARNHIVWFKHNSMPSSVKDRFTNKWESIFFFAKKTRYYFNLDNVRVKPKTESKPFNLRIREAKKGMGQLKLGDDPRAWKMSEQEDQTHNNKGEKFELEKDKKFKFKDEEERAKHRAGWTLERERANEDRFHINGKNPGDVFEINPHPFPEAHFATFPLELPMTILRCACPTQVCRKCGKPRQKIMNIERKENERIRTDIGEPSNPSGIRIIGLSTYQYP